MSSEVNYKQKYLELKAKFVNLSDVCWRLGYEAALKDSQVEQAQQAMAAPQQISDQSGQDSQESGQVEQQSGQPEAENVPQQNNPQGSELDKAIVELESLLGKSEVTQEDLAKAVNKLKFLKNEQELKKSEQAIQSIQKSLGKPTFTLSKDIKNLYNNNIAVQNPIKPQEKVLDDIFKKWNEQELKQLKK